MLPYEKIFENNKNWVQEKKEVNPAFFENMAKGQFPEYLYIGCSDSRAALHQLMGASPGEVFVHRNIGNVVSLEDPNAMSVIEYAINYLFVKHVVICGHYLCGGVMAASEKTEMDIIEPWIKHIRKVAFSHQDELKLIDDKDMRHERLVELNVQSQCGHILQTESYQKALKENRAPKVHGWVFNPASGILKDLNFNL